MTDSDIIESDDSVASSDIAAIGRIESVPVILEMVKQVTGMRFAAIARVTDCRWITCAVDDSIEFGLVPGAELVLESTICHEIRQHRKPVIFQQASKHPIFATHHTPLQYGLESYVSVPIITADGDFFGTLCAIDPLPASFDEEAVLKTLTLYAQLIATNLVLQRGLDRSESALADAFVAGRHREQFIAVLGHDLRTPLSAVRMSAELLQARLESPPNLVLVQAIRQSAQRMGILIEDVLDFARGKLGGGIPVKLLLVDDLERQFGTVIEEVRAVHPDATVEAELSVPMGIVCDPIRLTQLLSNLLNNAVTHGAAGMPVKVNVGSLGGCLVMAVENEGSPIAPELMDIMFQPFRRSESGQRGEGLGLGLYISHQICIAHGGTLEVASSAESGTRFVASIPCRAITAPVPVG